MDRSGAVYQGQLGEVSAHQWAQPLVVPSPNPAGLQPASRVPRTLLLMSAVPVDATQDLASAADMPPAFVHRVHDKGWAVQDHPEGPGHRRLVSHGH